MMKEHKSYKIYLDVCCLNRPFDDQTQLRIRLEAEAIMTIISQCQSGAWELISSTVLESEIGQTPSSSRKERLREALLIAKNKILVTQKNVQRSLELRTLSFKEYDALHLACAENNADIFLTTDDRLHKKALTYKDNLKITVNNPIIWLIEVTHFTGEQNDDPN